jgi:hypothetical protein
MIKHKVVGGYFLATARRLEMEGGFGVSCSGDTLIPIFLDATVTADGLTVVVLEEPWTLNALDGQPPTTVDPEAVPPMLSAVSGTYEATVPVTVLTLAATVRLAGETSEFTMPNTQKVEVGAGDVIKLEAGYATTGLKTSSEELVLVVEEDLRPPEARNMIARLWLRFLEVIRVVTFKQHKK